MASLAEQDSTPASGNANDANVKHNDVPEKVKVNLQATGRAQILKRNKFKLAKDDKFLKLQMFLRAQLKLEQSEALFLFINSSSFQEQTKRWGTCMKILMLAENW